jgi:tight adherence protein B
MVQVALYLGTFLTVVCLCLGLFVLVVGPRAQVLTRLKFQTLSAEEMKKAEVSARRGLREDVLVFLGMLGKVFSRQTYLEGLQRKLIHAHVFMRAEEFIGLSIVCGIGMMFLIYILTGIVFLTIIFGVLAGKIPDLVIGAKKSKRMSMLNEQLPDALSIMANGLRAGYSFVQAMDVVSREMEYPIADEFGRVVRENRLGKPMEDVLLDLTERTDNEDLDMVVTALLIQKQVGGNLAEILNKIEHTIRERVRIRGEIKTLTVQQRMSAVIIILLPIAVALLLLVMNPEYMLPLFRETAGLVMLGLAVFFQVIGIVLIRRISNIEV